LADIHRMTSLSRPALARICSEAFHDHPDAPDGVLYNSHLNRERNVALHDRALGKLKAKAAPRLVERRDELAAILNDFDIGIV
jgi:hypothetical protein